jgi:serine/threonine protein kinase
MARQCPNCGEDNLRDKARFCDNCGFKLTVEPNNRPAGFSVITDNSLNRPLPQADTVVNEDSTLRLPEVEVAEDEGATRAMPAAETLVDEGSTRSMPTLQTAFDDSATRSIPPEATPEFDDGLTKAAPEVETAGKPDTTPTILAETKLAVDTVIKDNTVQNKQPIVQVHERYQLIKILGKGGFGAAYLAEDVKLKRRCVVKQMLTKRYSTKELEVYRANFEREAKLLVELNDPGHPNIPEIYDYFSEDNGNYLVMKYIEGQNLKDALEQSEQRLPWREAVRYAVDVCSALNYMHAKGQQPVMHRDIKPANILLGNDGRVWLVDFGLAKANPVASSEDLSATQALGSLGYTPLEQWMGQAASASDVYALGVTLHHLVTGLNPMDAYGGQFNIRKLQEQHGQLPPIRKIDRSLPRELEEIISRTTAADLRQRPTALQLQQELQVLISGAQGVALYTFKNGKSAKTIGQLVDLCEQNRREAEEYLANGDFERWFLLINRNDLAEAARQAVKQGKNQKDNLEKFLKLILPNLALRRLNKAGLHLARGTLQFGLSAIIILLLVALGGSYLAGWFIRQSINTTDWNFEDLNLRGENRYTERYLTRRFNEAIGAYFEELEIELQPPDRFEIQAIWNGYPLHIPASLRLGNKKPRFHIDQVNNIPLFWIADNLSQGINGGIDDVFRQEAMDVSRMVVLEDAIVFNIAQDPRRLSSTPTPTPSPTPTPTPTPTPVNITLVVVFNELEQDVTLQIEDRFWNIAANDTEVLEMRPGTYNYKVTYQETNQVAAQGQKTWNLNKAYRLRIGLAE